MDGTFSLRDTPFDLTLGVWPHVLFHHLGVFDEHLLALRVDLQHASLFTLVTPRNDLDDVVLANICSRCRQKSLPLQDLWGQ